MRKLQLASVIFAFTAATTAQADFIGAKASVDYWQYNTDQSEFSLDDDSTAAIAVSFEHPIPVLPNAKIKYAQLKAEGNQLTNTDLDLDYADFILYYELLDNVVSLDLGLGAKVLNGTVLQQRDVDETLPMLYAEAGVKLPFTGLSAKAEVNHARSSDYRVTDAQAEVKYNVINSLFMDLGLKAGYRILDIKHDENQQNSVEFKGPYLGVEAHF